MKDNNFRFVSYLVFQHNLIEAPRTWAYISPVSISFPDVIFFKVLEIVFDDQDGFFIAHKFLFSQKTFAFPKQMEIRRSQIEWIGWMWKQFHQFLLSNTAWMDRCICHGITTPFFCHYRKFRRNSCLQSAQKECVVLLSDSFSLLKIVNEDSFHATENWRHYFPSGWNAFRLFRSQFSSFSLLFRFQRFEVGPNFVNCYKTPQKNQLNSS